MDETDTPPPEPVNPTIADFERYMGITTLADGGRMLGMTYQGYQKLRHRRDLPLVTRLALAAIVRGIEPYGDDG